MAPEKLREKAAKKLHGPDANPSQLGDPISLKNETSGSHSPADNKDDVKSSSPYSPPFPGPGSSSSSTSSDDKKKKTDGGEETLREKAAKKLHGPNANPSQLGDPISLKNETSEKGPTEKGKRESKL